MYCLHLETGNDCWPHYCCASFNSPSFQCWRPFWWVEAVTQSPHRMTSHATVSMYTHTHISSSRRLLVSFYFNRSSDRTKTKSSPPWKRKETGKTKPEKERHVTPLILAFLSLSCWRCFVLCQSSGMIPRTESPPELRDEVPQIVDGGFTLRWTPPVSINIRNWPNDFVCVCVCSHSGWDGSSSSSYLVLYPFQSPSYNTLSFHGDVVGIPIKRLDALYAMHFAVLQPITKQQFPFPFPCLASERRHWRRVVHKNAFLPL